MNNSPEIIVAVCRIEGNCIFRGTDRYVNVLLHGSGWYVVFENFHLFNFSVVEIIRFISHHRRLLDAINF